MSEFDPEFQGDEEIEIEAIGVEVNSQPIELYKVLKIADVVSGGGEAKYAITEGYVAVNGEIEVRKRRKLYDGDLIEFNQEYYVVICDAPVVEEPIELPKNKKQKPNKEQKTSPVKETAGKPSAVNTSDDEDSKPDTKQKKGGRGEIKFF